MPPRPSASKCSIGKPPTYRDGEKHFPGCLDTGRGFPVTAEHPATEVITASELADRVAELGAAISEDYRNRRPILVAMLVGALPFLADLVRRISVPLDVDFLSLSRFGEGGRLRVVLDTAENLSGRDVIIVEDIVDTGLSLTVLRRMMADRGAASVATVALLDKVPRRVRASPHRVPGLRGGRRVPDRVRARPRRLVSQPPFDLGRPRSRPFSRTPGGGRPIGVWQPVITWVDERQRRPHRYGNSGSPGRTAVQHAHCPVA